MLRGNNETITDDKSLANLFNEYCFYTVEQSNGLKPEKIDFHNKDFDKGVVLHDIIKKYENIVA